MNKKLGWHFVGETLRCGSPIPADNELLIFDGPVKICQSGLHASERTIDALTYAPGTMLCRVECGQVMGQQHDKFVCAERTILWRIDCKQILCEFARRVALDVVHLWNAPAIVHRYLETGDEAISAGRAAHAAAHAAADAAVYAAADATVYAADATVYAAAAAGRAAGRAAHAAGRAAHVAAAAHAAHAAAAAGRAAHAAVYAAHVAHAAHAAHAAVYAKYNTWLTETVLTTAHK